MKILDQELPDDDIRVTLEIFEDFAHWCADEHLDALAVFYAVSLQHAILCNRLATHGYGRDKILEVVKVTTDKAIKYAIQYQMGKIIDP